MLNEQLICEMFEASPEQPSPPHPREDISLNLTNSSHHPTSRDTDSDWMVSALSQLEKFEVWLQSRKGACNEELELCRQFSQQLGEEEQPLSVDELELLKAEVTRKDSESQPCAFCISSKAKVDELSAIIDSQRNEVEELSMAVSNLNQQLTKDAIEAAAEKLLSQIELQTLHSEIAQLHTEVTALRNEKATLERTFLFNKTRNSELGALQKSKNLSAAKNSTSSSQLLSRNHETLVLGGEGGEGDIEEWIRYFEMQKGRYRVLCVSEENDRQRQLGRAFTRKQRDQFREQRSVCTIFSAVKEFLITLESVRSQINGLEGQLKPSGMDQLEESERQEGWSMLWEENRLLKAKVSNQLLINKGLLCEQRNLEEVARQLRRLVLALEGRVLGLEEERKQLEYLVQEKEEQLLILAEGMRDYKGSDGQQERCRELMAEREIESVRLKEVVFLLKRESLERRRLLFQAEERKGLIRVICRVEARQEGKAVYVKGGQNDRLLQVEEQKAYKFDRVLSGNTIGKLPTELNRSLQCVLEGSNMCLVSCGKVPSAELSTEEVVVRGILDLISQEVASLEVQLKICFMEIVDEKASIGIGKQLLEDKGKERGVTTHKTVQIDHLQQFQGLYSQFLQSRDNIHARNWKQVYFLTVLSLDIYNTKTQQTYSSKINILEARHPGQDLIDLTKIISTVSLRQMCARYHDSKLTHLLKDTLSDNSIIIVLMNLSAGLGQREQTRQWLQMGTRIKGSQKIKQSQEQGVRQRRSVSKIGN